ASPSDPRPPCSSKELADPIGDDDVGTHVGSRVAFLPPTRDIRHATLVAEAKPRLVEDDPAAGATDSETECSGDESAETGRRFDVRRAGPRVHPHRTSDDLPDERLGYVFESVPELVERARRMRLRRHLHPG